MHILVTGAAGFIGAAVTEKLLSTGFTVIGLDNLNDYYDVQLKKDRLEQVITERQNFTFIQADVANRQSMDSVFEQNDFDVVIHLAAQAGVRYSLENPQSYVDSNLVGFANILEGCRHQKNCDLVYASSSSVYGENDKFPFEESDRVDHPVSFYAATKKANELMAHSYQSLYGLKMIGLRFFTVYGPWGRPDMAPFRFASRMLAGEEIPVYNHGNMIRDFTYIDDIVEGVVQVALKRDQATEAVYNIGRGEPVELMKFIKALEIGLGVEAKIKMLPMQDGDVPRTMADTALLKQDFSYQPKTSIDKGVAIFAKWYKEYFQQ